MKVLEALQDPVFDLLGEASRVAGLPAYVIGGYVRDFFLQRSCKDIDIVVEGSGIEMAKAFAQQAGSKDVVTYANFGTALVNYKEYEVEFVGARKESYRKNSRNPEVEAGTLEDDQLRRDFTINALSFSLNPETWESWETLLGESRTWMPRLFVRLPIPILPFRMIPCA